MKFAVTDISAETNLKQLLLTSTGFPTEEKKYTISTTMKYVYVKHNWPAIFPQVCKLKQAAHPFCEFLALEAESG